TVGQERKELFITETSIVLRWDEASCRSAGDWMDEFAARYLVAANRVDVEPTAAPPDGTAVLPGKVQSIGTDAQTPNQSYQPQVPAPELSEQNEPAVEYSAVTPEEAWANYRFSEFNAPLKGALTPPDGAG